MKGSSRDYVAVYLEAADAASAPSGWKRYVEFRLGVVSQVRSRKTLVLQLHILTWDLTYLALPMPVSRLMWRVSQTSRCGEPASTSSIRRQVTALGDSPRRVRRLICHAQASRISTLCMSACNLSRFRASRAFLLTCRAAPAARRLRTYEKSLR